VWAGICPRKPFTRYSYKANDTDHTSGHFCVPKNGQIQGQPFALLIVSGSEETS